MKVPLLTTFDKQKRFFFLRLKLYGEKESKTFKLLIDTGCNSCIVLPSQNTESFFDLSNFENSLVDSVPLKLGSKNEKALLVNAKTELDGVVIPIKIEFSSLTTQPLVGISFLSLFEKVVFNMKDKTVEFTIPS